ncbi:MAG: type phosphodiesterase/nucleotide pyrophosphatase [Bryobacterales bacterium]|nr:type phosphodiesterase/nucleotide pyrophosphatase [Bryobacterales bacterium]
MKRRNLLLALCAAGLIAHAVTHQPGDLQLSYIGPGAGFAFLGSFLTLLTSLVLSVVSFLIWPFRMLWLLVSRRQGFRKARIKKLIFLGLDGFDPGLAERFMSEGKLPNLKRLKEQGSYRRLRTTFPALSPVAWSTFATGVNPGKHNIFDFLNRDLKTYVPELSSSKVRPPERVLRLGRWRIPLSRPSVEMRRKSEPFWKILGRHSIGCTILRVPITFPPDHFNGRLLSAMCTPDLRGTQGSFSHFSTRVETGKCEGGNRYPLRRVKDVLEGELEGPENSFVEGQGAMRIPFRILRAEGGDGASLEIQGESYPLQPGEYTPWVRLRFHGGVGISVNGIARFLLTQTEPEVSLYVTPIQIDPESPALPISQPAYYAIYLAKLLGSFATLGMAEDTWALNEGAIDEDAFLKQSEMIKREREAMFFSALERTRRGVVACVFDTTDRVQHMFYRHLDAGDGKVIEALYCDMDRMVGETWKHVDQDTALFVLSDHGFCSFRRGVNLNSWLHQNGYLALLDGAQESGDYFEGVDWSRTRAYTFGLGGLYLNLKSREAQGIVSPSEAAALKKELIRKLSNLRDEEKGAVGIRNVYASSALYKGPYLDAAPDLIVGYAAGYRTSWEAAVGKISARVFEDNKKAWSGDHCVDPLLVPGVLFSNRKVEAEDPGIEDMAPTALALFGIEAPAWMEGKSVFRFVPN